MTAEQKTSYPRPFLSISNITFLSLLISKMFIILLGQNYSRSLLVPTKFLIISFRRKTHRNSRTKNYGLASTPSSFNGSTALSPKTLCSLFWNPVPRLNKRGNVYVTFFKITSILVPSISRINFLTLILKIFRMSRLTVKNTK